MPDDIIPARKPGGANYSYAETRLGRQPILYSHDQSQFNAIDSPKDWGGTFSPDLTTRMSLGLDPTAGALASPVRELLGKGQPVSVIAPYQASKSGLPGDSSGTPAGVPLHEATHQFTADAPMPLAALRGVIDPSTSYRMEHALDKMNYPQDKYSGEMLSRLAAGQFGSLGLSDQEGPGTRDAVINAYRSIAPRHAARLSDYTSGRSLQKWAKPDERNP